MQWMYPIPESWSGNIITTTSTSGPTIYYSADGGFFLLQEDFDKLQEVTELERIWSLECSE